MSDESLAGRYPDCLDCEGRGEWACPFCTGGSADCDECNGEDRVPCSTCERRAYEQRRWRAGERPKVVR